MVLILLAHLAAALAAPQVVGKLGRRAFLLLALAPGAAAVWAARNTEAILAGEVTEVTYSWVPGLGIDVGIRLDPLSWLLVLIVGGVGAVVLVYCSGYFARRSSGMGRFAAVLTAFAGAMLGLVTSSNLIQLYVFWELTTVFSYLLIGHYSDRGSSRRAAMKAILVTTFGGLAMLLGLLLLGAEAGTYDIATIVASPPTGTPARVSIVLLLLGAVTKSALIPFHFWLPAAMTAPTPVSAYLHAAAMVKAGIYLVARFAPAFALDAVWQAMVLVVACGTLLFGGYKALRQHDLKLILAYGTVSQLGLIILLVGSPYRAIALSGLALLGAHALFKASLFLIVGVIDATTGTRDIRRLRGLGRKMPVTAIVGALATASMIGLMPFAGFVAKEAALHSLLDPGQPFSFRAVVLTCFVGGSILTTAYGLRFLWGAFGAKSSELPAYPIVITQPRSVLIGPPAVLAVAGLLVALILPWSEPLVLHADTYPLGAPGHLALFSGFTLALLTTVVVFVVGVGIFLLGDRVERVRLPWPASWDADLVYRHTLRRLDQLAGSLTALFQRGSLPFYLGGILIVVIAFTGGALVVGTSPPDDISWRLAPTQAAVGALIVTAAVLAARARRRLKAVILAGITGYGTAMLFLLYGAPDLALTQVLVETVTLVVFVLVLRRLPVYFSNRPRGATRWVRIALGAVTGVLVAGLAFVVPQYRIHEPVSTLFPEEAVAYGGGYNIVNVALVDIRAWDTVGEISVLLVAATGIASLIFVSGRGRRASDLTTLESKAGTIGATDPDPMDRLRWRPGGPDSGERPPRPWLVGGITLAPQRRSIVLEVATRIVYHTMVVFSIYLLFAGHNAPGGGFVAGLITGIALVVRYLAGGRYELSAAAPLQPSVVLGTGLFLSAGLGLTAMLLGGEVLQSAVLEWTIPAIGEVKLVTSVFFDIGVYLVVIGLMLDVLKSLGAEIDQQGESSGHDSDLVGPALEPPPAGGPR